MRKITLIGCSGKENQRDKRNRKRQRKLTDFIHLLRYLPVAFATFTLYIDIFLVSLSNDECRLLLSGRMVISSRTGVELGARWPSSPVFVLGV